MDIVIHVTWQGVACVTLFVLICAFLYSNFFSSEEDGNGSSEKDSNRRRTILRPVLSGLLLSAGVLLFRGVADHIQFVLRPDLREWAATGFMVAFAFAAGFYLERVAPLSER